MKQLALFFLVLLVSTNAMAKMSCSEAMVRTQVTQEVEYLRRMYAKATDKIGVASEVSIEEGREIYRQIFASDATLDAGPGREPQVGPDAWVDLVLGVLGPLGPTQHLIGTQLVEIKNLELNDDCEIVSGSASMESYVQAWHEQKDERVWLFLGTYFDEAEYKPGIGWQIVDMKMEQVAGETRYMDAAVGKAD